MDRHGRQVEGRATRPRSNRVAARPAARAESSGRRAAAPHASRMVAGRRSGRRGAWPGPSTKREPISSRTVFNGWTMCRSAMASRRRRVLVEVAPRLLRGRRVGHRPASTHKPLPGRTVPTAWAPSRPLAPGKMLVAKVTLSRSTRGGTKPGPAGRGRPSPSRTEPIAWTLRRPTVSTRTLVDEVTWSGSKEKGPGPALASGRWAPRTRCRAARVSRRTVAGRMDGTRVDEAAGDRYRRQGAGPGRGRGHE
jgi:hypothetical protein